MRWFRNEVQIPGNETLKHEAANTGAVYVNTFTNSIGHDVGFYSFGAPDAAEPPVA
jgi:hypothetical protein